MPVFDDELNQKDQYFNNEGKIVARKDAIIAPEKYNYKYANNDENNTYIIYDKNDKVFSEGKGKMNFTLQ